MAPHGIPYHFVPIEVFDNYLVTTEVFYNDSVPGEASHQDPVPSYGTACARTS